MPLIVMAASKLRLKFCLPFSDIEMIDKGAGNIIVGTSLCPDKQQNTCKLASEQQTKMFWPTDETLTIREGNSVCQKLFTFIEESSIQFAF